MALKLEQHHKAEWLRLPAGKLPKMKAISRLEEIRCKSCRPEGNLERDGLKSRSPPDRDDDVIHFAVLVRITAIFGSNLATR